MPILFTKSWDIIPGCEQEYSEFIAKTFITEIAGMGLVPVGGFYVEVGFGPRVIGVSSCENYEKLAGIVTSQRFKDLILKLKAMVFNYRTAVLEPLAASRERPTRSRKGSGSSTSTTTFVLARKKSIRTIS